MSENTHIVPFSEPDTTVPILTKYVLEEQVEFDGEVVSIVLSFPDGCNSNVRIKCFVNTDQVLPSHGYIALNNFTKDFPVERRVRNKDYLVVEIENRDPVFPHTPSIIWTIRRHRIGVL